MAIDVRFAKARTITAAAALATRIAAPFGRPPGDLLAALFCRLPLRRRGQAWHGRRSIKEPL
jgi:hypothetical protein